MKKRIKYYPSNDLLHAHNLTKIEVIQIPRFENIDINDALEFYQIKRYFDEKTKLISWSDADYVLYAQKCKQLFALTQRFFGESIKENNIIDLYNSIEFGYHSEFWVMFDNCKLYERISDPIFSSLIECKLVSPMDLFAQKDIVKHYGNVLRNYILSHDSCITLVLHVYELNFKKDKKLYLPGEFTGEDVNTFFESYVDSVDPNANHLKMIMNMIPYKEFPITDEIRLKAKRRYHKEIERISKNGIGMIYDLQLSINEEQIEEIVPIYENGIFGISYSKQYLEKTLDYPSILNNFLYIFEFADIPQMRWRNPSKTSRSSIFERFLTPQSPRLYNQNFSFCFYEEFSSMQMEAYYKFLEQNGINLEEVLHWFFTEYLQDEFSCSEMRFSMPTQGSTYAEKCFTIIAAFESVLKQYSLYLKHGEIDFELLVMSTTPIRFCDMKSLIDKKYIYGKGEDYYKICYFLFSDQCNLSYTERLYAEGKDYNHFIDLLYDTPVYLSDYDIEAHSVFAYLEGFELVKIGENGAILPNNEIKLFLLKDLYDNDVVNRKHYPPEAQESINQFLEKGLLMEESTLFSKPETNYLNYLLNRSEFSNGLEIRNKYMHGIQQVNLNENEHYSNYMILLKIFVLLAIKINDEFCLKAEQENIHDS